MIPLISFDREKTLRKYCVSVYILISPKRKKVEKIRYNKSTYKILSSETISIDENNIESINDLIEKIKKLKSREDK